MLGLIVIQLQDPNSRARVSNPDPIPSETPASSETNPGQPDTPGTPASTDPVASPVTTAQNPATTTTAPPVTQELTAVGGTVTVRCQGNTAAVQSVQPAAGFTATTQSRGASSQAHVVLASPTHQSDIRARCGPQGLVPTVEETALAANPQTGT